MRLLALFSMVLPAVSGAVLLVSTPASRRAAKLVAIAALVVAAGLTAVLFGNGRVAIFGSFESDPLSSFLVELLLVALAIPLVRRSEDGLASGRLFLGGALAILAVSTRDLLWSTLPVLAFPLVVSRGREEEQSGRNASVKWACGIASLAGLAAIAFQSRGTDLAAIAASGGAGTSVGRAGLALVAAGLVLLWLAHSRDLFRHSDHDLVKSVCSSFLHLVAVTSVLLRLTAWLPDAAPLGTIRVLALSALVLGALGMLGSTRIRTFVTALALARAGIVLVALLGGIHGRMPLLLELATTAASLILLTWGIEAVAVPGENGGSAASLDELDPGASTSARIGLLVGALSACSLPPFPGFTTRFPLSRALASEGETFSLIAASVLVFLVGLGSMRVVSRAFAGGSAVSRRPGRREALVGLGLAAIAMWFLGIYPVGLIDLASRAVAEMF